MDEAELEKYIREKSNGRNIIKIRIIESLLGREFAKRWRLWKDVFVYVRKYWMYLPQDFHDPTLRRNETKLHEKFEKVLLQLLGEGVVTERKGKDEFMLGLDLPIADYDVDHTLSKLIWTELDVTPKDPADDYTESDKADKALKNVERILQNTVADYNFWNVENVQRKAGSDDITINFDLVKKRLSELSNVVEPKPVEKLPSLTKSIGKTVSGATPEEIAFSTIRQMEKYMRKFVADVMSHNGNWWKTNVPSDVRKEVHKRMEKKKIIRARSVVKLDPIMRSLNDTDLGQLIEIIRFNLKEFDEAFMDKNLERISPFLTGLYERRNAIDHPDETIPIDKEFLGALDYLCTYVMKQTEIYYQKESPD